MTTIRLSTPVTVPPDGFLSARLPNLPRKSQEFEFQCASIIDGVAVDPNLPPNFDSMANDSRPVRHLAWWGIPFIQVTANSSPQFKTLWPEGHRYDVRCLDGGAWDRSTAWGALPSLQEAVALAKDGNPHRAGVGFVSTAEHLRQLLAKTGRILVGEKE